jgi:hypothetical protein
LLPTENSEEADSLTDPCLTPFLLTHVITRGDS